MARGRGLVEQQRVKAVFERDQWKDRALTAETKLVGWMERCTKAEMRILRLEERVRILERRAGQPRRVGAASPAKEGR